MKLLQVRLRRLLLFAVIFVSVVVFLVIRYSNLYYKFNQVGSDLTAFVGETLSAKSGVDYCKSLPRWTPESPYPPIQKVSKELGIKDGERVFINGIRCGEWLIALKQTFPKIKLFATDRHPDIIKYVSTLVNASIVTSKPWELTSLPFKDEEGEVVSSFDRAIVDGVLLPYDKDLQCETMRKMIPLVKPGGSMFLGKNIEPCHGNVTDKIHSYHGQILPKCFWSESCLLKRHDISEILYMKETDIMPAVDASSNQLGSTACPTAVFIYKNIMMVSKLDKDPLKPELKYEKDKHAHVCTLSESKNATTHNIEKVKFDKEGILNAVKQMKEKGIDMR